MSDPAAPDSAPPPDPIVEKQSRLASLQHQITTLKTSLQDLHVNIARVKGEIVAYENANTLFEHARTATIPEHATPSTAPVTINEEHLNILAAKQNELTPLRTAVAELRQAEDVFETRLDGLREEAAMSEYRVLDLEDEIRAERSLSQGLQTELTYLAGQIRERTTEIRNMAVIRRQAEAAAAEILTKLEGDEKDDGGRLDCEKAVEKLRREIRDADAELAGLEDQINHAKTDGDAERLALESTQAEHEEAVKWAREKQELKEELERLTAELAERKGEVQATETRAFVDHSQLAQVAPLIKKWKDARGAVTVPDRATVGGLLTDLARVRKTREEALRVEQEKVAALIVANAALEKEVLRSKAALDCTVEVFHSNEARLREEIDDVKAKAIAEEQKLLAQIAKAKLHVGQARLQRG
jgi:chromosome segregation ATPase